METPATDPVVMPPSLLAEIQTAAEEEHRTTNELVQDAVKQYLEHRRWHYLVLSVDDQQRVADALLNPPEPTPALRDAVRRHREQFGSA